MYSRMANIRSLFYKVHIRSFYFNGLPVELAHPKRDPKHHIIIVVKKGQALHLQGKEGLNDLEYIFP